MKLTTKSEYSLLALIYIARHEDEEYTRMEDIADEYNISKKYLEQILIPLKQARYLKSKTGAGGGYRLSIPAGDISLAEIIRLMDGALAPTLAASRYFFEHTPLEKEKKIIQVFTDIRNLISGKLEEIKISDLT